MAKRLRVGGVRRAANAIVRRAILLGVAGRNDFVLVTRGRRTGREHANPVRTIVDGGRWLVAPYGVTDWVRNVRAAGEARLRRRGHDAVYRAVEVPPAEGAPILRRYVRRMPIVRGYVAASVNAPSDAWEDEVASHPVFRLEPKREITPA